MKLVRRLSKVRSVQEWDAPTCRQERSRAGDVTVERVTKSKGKLWTEARQILSTPAAQAH